MHVISKVVKNARGIIKLFYFQPASNLHKQKKY